MFHVGLHVSKLFRTEKNNSALKWCQMMRCYFVGQLYRLKGFGICIDVPLVFYDAVTQEPLTNAVATREWFCLPDTHTHPPRPVV